MQNVSRSPSLRHTFPVINMVFALFSVRFRALWLALAVAMLALQVVPLSLGFEARFPVFVFEAYQAVKLIGILALGLLTPLAWWDYRSLIKCALVAVLVTGGVEFGQAFIQGHRASTLELTIKLLLLFAGFLEGLNVRKYQRFTIGRLRLDFSSPYWRLAICG